MKNFKLIFFFLIIMLPNIVKAYGINNYYIDAIIQSNGDVLIQEYFNLTGEYNGFERIIEYANEDLYEFDPNMNSFGGSLIHNGNGLEIKEVRATPIVNNFDFNNIDGDIFKIASTAKKGDYGVYTVTDKNNGKNILIYNPSIKNKAFYLKYIIKNVAIRHNDIAEIGWNIIGNEFRESISNLEVILHIPNNQNIKAWAHGPINGNIEIINPETVKFQINGLSSYRAIDIRATFDLDVINESNKTTNTDALDKIVLYETNKAAQSNYERQNKQKIIINQAETRLNEFEVNIKRYNYNSALEAINKITDGEKKNELLNKLTILKKELDTIEENEARETLEYTFRYPTYYNYKNLQEKILILDNYEIKQELLVELNKVEEILKDAEKKQEQINYIKGISYIIFLIILGMYSYKKYISNPKIDFNQKYYREITDELPTTVSYLMYKKITKNSLSASMLDLVRRKIVTAEKLAKNNYKLTLNDSKIEIPSVYRRLISLIFGNKSCIETKDIKKYARKNYDSYIRNWKQYNEEALDIAKENLYFETDKNEKLKTARSRKDYSFLVTIFIILLFIVPILGVILFFGYIIYIILYNGYKSIKNFFVKNFDKKKILITFIYILISILSIYKIFSILALQKFYNNSFKIYIAILILSIVLMTVLYKNKKRTKEGTFEYKKWKAIKNFLNDFGSFQDKEVPEVELWEKYLVFATLFGCSKKVLKVMKIEEIENPNMPSDIYYNFRFANTIAKTITSSYASARSVYAAENSSSGGGGYSSGSGGGGGFSSGGGSFGGGGGGGRF